jgi:hypothetical protein
VLVGIDDVEPGRGEEAADRGDQAGPVGAGEQQAGCRRLGDLSIIPAPPRPRPISGQVGRKKQFIFLAREGFRA